MGTGLIRHKRMYKFTSEQRYHSATIANQMQNMIEGSLTARFYNLGSILKKKLLKATQQNYNSGRSCTHIVFFNAMLAQIGYMLAYTGPMIFGMILVTNGSLSLSQMVSIWPIAVGVAYAIQRIGYFFTVFQITASAIDRVCEVMDLPPEIESGTEILPEGNLKIEFKDVSFSYSDGKNVLSHISFSIKQGEHIAFVGESGSGKTTLMKLLLRFYEPTSGEILLNDLPITRFSLASVRSKFSYVPQSTHLLDDSIFNNIAIVKQDASMDEVVLSAHKAYSSEFIEKMDFQYNSVIGENGLTLSGGQQQRIAIARAFINNTNVVIFDEITSALDNESEKKINLAVKNMDHDCTLLMITHKLSSAHDCDRIVVLHKGCLCEIGSHEELILQNGFYAKLWNKNIMERIE